eukprot:4488068-Pleurochrysis_carterae.AAC.1
MARASDRSCHQTEAARLHSRFLAPRPPRTKAAGVTRHNEPQAHKRIKLEKYTQMSAWISTSCGLAKQHRAAPSLKKRNSSTQQVQKDRVACVKNSHRRIAADHEVGRRPAQHRDGPVRPAKQEDARQGLQLRLAKRRQGCGRACTLVRREKRTGMSRACAVLKRTQPSTPASERSAPIRCTLPTTSDYLAAGITARHFTRDDGRSNTVQRYSIDYASDGNARGSKREDQPSMGGIERAAHVQRA